MSNPDSSLRQDHQIDFDFISTFEGGNLLDGYVPDAAKSKSGITIAIGFDLGARNLGDLEALGLEAQLIELLLPYLGLQGQKAADYLGSHPLRITEANAKTINTAVKRKLIESLIRKYNTDAELAFAMLPTQWQTVIASVEFQYGSLQRKCPSFWRCVTKPDWTKAIAELRDFGDRYTTRRNKEADYAEKNS